MLENWLANLASLYTTDEQGIKQETSQVMSKNKVLAIEHVEGGFWQYVDHTMLSKIWSEFDSGAITVFYKNGSTKTVMADCAGYNSQYGTPVSDDGRKLVIGAWEKRQGLRCYSIEKGNMIWQLHIPRVRQVFCFSDYLAVLEAKKALLKINLDNGEILAHIRSNTIENQFWISKHLVFVDSIKGTPCVINTESMRIVKEYPLSVVNPNSRKSFIINNVELSESGITIFGFESVSNEKSRFALSPFSRIIDAGFHVGQT